MPMFIKDLHDCEPFRAGDGTLLRELLHPDKAKIDLRYSLAYAIVGPGQSSRLHRLKTSEVYYILEGKGSMHIDNEMAEVFPNQAVYIPPHSRQFIQNTGDTELRFLCIVDPAWIAENEVVL